MIDAHHHLWDLDAVSYPWLEARGVTRFFGDPTPIQRNYLLDEFTADARANGILASVHIQVGAADGMAEARWVQQLASANPDWPIVQVPFCDLGAPDFSDVLDEFSAMPSVKGVRQIIGRAPGEDAATGTNALLASPAFRDGMSAVGKRGLSFDLQLIPELMAQAAEMVSEVAAKTPHIKIALCHAGSPYDRTPAGLAEWAAALTTLSALPQVTCKLSGLGMFQHDWQLDDFRPIIDTCLDQFGEDRCMFGSNFPVDSLYSNYEKLINAHRTIVPDAMHDAVFNSTAARFYGFADL